MEEYTKCYVRTLYRQFKKTLIKPHSQSGERKPNVHKERRGKQFFKRNIVERAKDYPQFKQEFGHIEGDTIVSVHYKKCHHHVIGTSVESHMTLKSIGRKTSYSETEMNHCVQDIPKNLFLSSTFNCITIFYLEIVMQSP